MRGTPQDDLKPEARPLPSKLSAAGQSNQGVAIDGCARQSANHSIHYLTKKDRIIII